MSEFTKQMREDAEQSIKFTEGYRPKVLKAMLAEIDLKRAALAELRELLFRGVEPDEDAGEWEREAWRIIARALAEVPSAR